MRTLALLAGALAALLLARSAAAQETPPPNIVLIYIDDMGWTDGGVFGSDFYQTPRIDELAASGMRFTNAYANAPNCAPSRACLLTGQYTPRHGVYTVNNSARGKAKNRKLIPTPNTKTLDPTKITIAEVLRDAGYATAHIGKWHLGEGDTGPLAQGFDVNIGGTPLGHPRRYFTPYENETLPDGADGEYLTDRLTDEAARFIRDNQQRPFFLYLSHYAVHTPLQAKQEKIDRYKSLAAGRAHKNATYAAMIESVDESVGRIVDLLDELELRERTLVIFFSDNGGHAGATRNLPLRGAKGMLYEGGVRVPMIASQPGTIETGTINDTPVIGTDLFPTFAELARAAPPEDHPLDGVSLLPMMRGEGAGDDRPLLWHFPAYLEAGGGSSAIWRTTPAGAIRLGDWKLIEYFEDGRLELYNIADDLAERRNLAEQIPEKAAELHGLMKTWRHQIGAPVPTERNPRYQTPDQ